jgi:hypothetical protein
MKVMKMFSRKKSKEDTKKTDAVLGPGGSSVPGGSTVFRVTVPDFVGPGERFEVYTGTRIVRVKCPLGSKPGQSLHISVPTDPGPSQEGSAGSSSGAANLAYWPPDSPSVRRIIGSKRTAYMVAIPDRVRAGAKFPVTIQGQQLLVTCPPKARPGMSVRIFPPPPLNDVTRGPTADTPKTQLFEVEVPKGVQPGAPFAFLVGGVRVLVTIPPNAGPGQRIRFKLPVVLMQKPKVTNEAAQIKLKDDKDGWTRSFLPVRLLGVVRRVLTNFRRLLILDPLRKR